MTLVSFSYYSRHGSRAGSPLRSENCLDSSTIDDLLECGSAANAQRIAPLHAPALPLFPKFALGLCRTPSAFLQHVRRCRSATRLFVLCIAQKRVPVGSGLAVAQGSN